MDSGFVPRSTSHPIGKCVDNHTLRMKWLPQSEFDHFDSDGMDRYQGYDLDLTNYDNTVPVGNLSANTASGNEVVYPYVGDGYWWFHMRAYSTIMDP